MITEPYILPVDDCWLKLMLDLKVKQPCMSDNMIDPFVFKHEGQIPRRLYYGHARGV